MWVVGNRGSLRLVLTPRLLVVAKSLFCITDGYKPQECSNFPFPFSVFLGIVEYILYRALSL